jgi:hypothetical protein
VKVFVVLARWFESGKTVVELIVHRGRTGRGSGLKEFPKLI